LRSPLAAIQRRALPLAMLAVGASLLAAGMIYAPTFLIPSALYLLIGIRGMRVMRAREHLGRDNEVNTSSPSRSSA